LQDGESCGIGEVVAQVGEKIYEMQLTLDGDVPTYLPKNGDNLKVIATLYSGENVANDVSYGISVTFTLGATSNYPGYCTNGGDNNDRSNDFALVDPTSGAETNSVTFEFPSQGKAIIKIILRCKDYGGWTKVSATSGSEKIEPDSRDLRLDVPKDVNPQNHIADVWESQYGGNLNETDDNDALPQGLNNGDGLTAFEEYRGFMVDKKHERTNPNLKDLFINSDIGYGVTGKTGLTLHLIRKNETDDEKYINFNGGRDQKALRVDAPGKRCNPYNDPYGCGEYGYVVYPSGTITFTPNNAKSDCVVYIKDIEHDLLPNLQQLGIDIITGHEVGHAINMKHQKFDSKDYMYENVGEKLRTNNIYNFPVYYLDGNLKIMALH
jgi:hypothetical protein